jgi:hypothetical protein
MKMFDRRGMSFTIESMTLRMLIFSGKKIESWYSVPLGKNMVREGMVTTPDAVGSVMAEAIQENDIPKKGVVTAVPSAGSAPQTINLPGVKKGSVKEMISREIKRAMPGSQDVDFVYWQMLPENGGGKQQRVYALAVPRSNITGVVDACRAGGVNLKGIELKPFALYRAVDCKEGIIVHGEMDSIEVVIVEKSFPALFRCIAVKDATPSAEEASQNLKRELPFTIDYYNRSFRDAKLTPEVPVYLSGELALDPALAMEITETTGREVIGVEPKIECPPNFPLAQFLTNVGLMLRENWG